MYKTKLQKYKLEQLKAERQYFLENYDYMAKALGVMDYSKEEKLKMYDDKINSFNKRGK